MKKDLKKRMLMLLLSCFICLQPTVSRAKDNSYHELKGLAAIVLICSWKIILPQCKKFLNYLYNQSYAGYRNLKHYRYHVESAELRNAKMAFKIQLEELDAKNQSMWADKCYPYLFRKDMGSEKTIENFIEGQEQIEEKYTGLCSGLSCANTQYMEIVLKEKRLNKEENDLFTQSVSKFPLKDSFDREFFIQDGLELIKEVRKNQVKKLLGVCCGAYVCKSDVHKAITEKYPDIKASQLFSAFRSASDKSNTHTGLDEKKLITKELIFACIALNQA